ncbi:Monoacylglycerol Lipase [Klebsormidium nitens]|uniref:Monoacylglycerol Lipase n=1 Tax=Klebsormidium nitens TaxID=105231 RepID=A0A1Y1IFL1_KLENI|nr:Monoacylglycerol Lipase [Klebsormidium nitens]|eukprot:GAQ88822.1 Monoacylglycerol Lipase [Klebsormidium nitens]
MPELFQGQDSRPLTFSWLSAENFVKETLQAGALAHLSTPPLHRSGGLRSARFEVDKVSGRRGLRFLLGSPPMGSGNLAFQTEVCTAEPLATEPGTECPFKPVPDNSPVRRSLANRAAKQTPEKRWSRHSERHFVNKNGHRIYTQQWTPDGTPMKAAVVVFHGLNEHSGRYKHLARQLTKQGYGVFGMDWYGHGRSDGLHGFVDRLDNTVQDAGAYLKMVKRLNPGVPCFVYGHSTGAAIALKATQTSPRSELAGLVLTAPAIAIQPPHPVLATLLPFFSEVVPTLQVEAANRSDIKNSRDPASLLDKYSDPLVYTGSIRVRTGSEVLRIASDVRQNLHRVRHPFFVCHGTGDRVTLPEGSHELFRRAPVAQKKLKLYPGCLHDLLLEPEKDELVRDVVSWMDGRLNEGENGEEELSVSGRREEKSVRGGSVGLEMVERC